MSFLEWPRVRHLAGFAALADPELLPVDRLESDEVEPELDRRGFHEARISRYNALYRPPLTSRAIPFTERLAAVVRVDPPEYEEEEVPIADRDFDPPPLPDPRAWMRP